MTRSLYEERVKDRIDTGQHATLAVPGGYLHTNYQTVIVALPGMRGDRQQRQVARCRSWSLKLMPMLPDQAQGRVFLSILLELIKNPGTFLVKLLN